MEASETATEASSETATKETTETTSAEAVTEETTEEATEAVTEEPAGKMEETLMEEDMLTALAADEGRTYIGLAGVVDGVYHWTYKGKDAYCLTHGKTMNTNLAASQEDESADSKKWGQVLATLLAITKGNGYNSIQYDIWEYQSGGSNGKIQYSEHAYTVNIGLSPSYIFYNNYIVFNIISQPNPILYTKN